MPAQFTLILVITSYDSQRHKQNVVTTIDFSSKEKCEIAIKKIQEEHLAKGDNTNNIFITYVEK